MKRVSFALAMGLLLASCHGKPEEDRDLKAAFATSNLKDPSSVQLRNVAENDDLICGEYNAKNSWGAYGGFSPFVFQRSIKVLTLGDSDGSNMGTLIDLGDKCPNSAQLGLVNPYEHPTQMNATDLNATDLNAATNESVAAADAELNATDEAVRRTGEEADRERAAANPDTAADPESDNTADQPDNSADEPANPMR